MLKDYNHEEYIENNKLTSQQQAIVFSHIMRRFLINFKTHERVKVIEDLLKRVSKYLRKRERVNVKEFIFATEFEMRLWKEVTSKYDHETRILGLDFVSQVYEYYKADLVKHTNITAKMMDKINYHASDLDIDSKDMYEMEMNDGSLIKTLVRILEPYTGVSVKKSLFTGKKLTIKNNLILERKIV